MKYIYFCPKCKDTYSSEGKDKIKKCRKCKVYTIQTKLELSEWKSRSPEEQAALKQNFAKLSPPEVKEEDDSNSSTVSSNGMGIFLGFLGVIYIVVSIIGAFVLAEEVSSEVGFLAGFFGCMAGILLLAFGEVLNLLQGIKDK